MLKVIQLPQSSSSISNANSVSVSDVEIKMFEAITHFGEKRKEIKEINDAKEKKQKINKNFVRDTIRDITFYRTYARENNGIIENFYDTVNRVCRAVVMQLGVSFSKDDITNLKELMMHNKISVAGRFLWQLGTSTVDKLGLMSLQNCAATVIDDYHKILWIMDSLMLGVGVGINVQNKYIVNLPVVKHARITRASFDIDDSVPTNQEGWLRYINEIKNVDFIVPDTREGWVELIRRVLDSHFVSGKDFVYTTRLIRKKGERINTFGGIASGPDILCTGVNDINTILNLRVGQKPRSIDMLDVICAIAKIVKSGNVRRSALLAAGDPNDEEFLKYKRWDLQVLPDYRYNVNISVICNDYKEIKNNALFWKTYEIDLSSDHKIITHGDPIGLLNLELAKSCGRLGDRRYPDPNVAVTNPCAEQFLCDKETCCLAELFLPNIESYDELVCATRLLYRINKHSLLLKCHQRDTEQIVHANLRMGIGMTGYLQATPEQKSWLAPNYEQLRDYDNKYSDEHKIPRSIKLTTIKPSGTLGLIGGTTPGVHPAYSRYYLRRIRIPVSHFIVPYLIRCGYAGEYDISSGREDKDTYVFSFPCDAGENTVTARDCDVLQQLRYVKELQTNWSDNAVSVTGYYQPSDLPRIKEYLEENYNSTIKGISFLLHSDNKFVQAPYEEITSEQYRLAMASIKPLHIFGHINLTHPILADKFMSDGECAGGVCPIR